jgi:NAD(P)-dependent dehydrogenase (short-subunit alcohol dehydrogenase family)
VLNARTIIVTGASRGIGAATALEAARRGARLILAARNQERLAAVSEQTQALGAPTLTQVMDVTDAAAWEALFAAAIGEFGRVDGLVNNAGVHALRKLEDNSEADFDWIVGSNVKSVFLGTRQAFLHFPEFASNGAPAAIVNVSSTAGLTGASFQALYNMTKGAVQLLTKASAQEAIDRRLPIRVNSVNPGMVDTDMGDDVVAAALSMGFADSPAQIRKNLTRGYMDRRFARPEEVAKAICFLLSHEASFTTGEYLTVDGGFTNA